MTEPSTDEKMAADLLAAMGAVAALDRLRGELLDALKGEQANPPDAYSLGVRAGLRVGIALIVAAIRKEAYNA